MINLLNKIKEQNLIVTFKVNDNEPGSIIIRIAKSAKFPDGEDRLIFKEYSFPIIILFSIIPEDLIDGCIKHFIEFYSTTCNKINKHKMLKEEKYTIGWAE